MTADEAAAVLSALDSVHAWQEDFYRDLHSRPELTGRRCPCPHAATGARLAVTSSPDQAEGPWPHLNFHGRIVTPDPRQRRQQRIGHRESRRG